jgi:hypothetical protein
MSTRRSSIIFQLPYLPVWLTPAILFIPMLFGGQALFWGTPYLQFVPWRTAAVEILNSGQLPLWNPWVGMGAPLLANYQSALLYPPNWFLLALQALGGTGAQAWGQALVIWMHLVWAGMGMIFLVRDLGMKKTAQTVAGLSFGMSVFLVARSGFLSINAAVAWTPWVLWATNRIAGPRIRPEGEGPTKSGYPTLWLAGTLGMQLLSGHAQMTWYTLLLAAAWVIFWGYRAGGWRSLYRALTRFVLGGLLAGGIAAIQLIPTAEFLLQSQRSSAVDVKVALNYSFWPWHLLTLVAPDLFGSPVRGDYWFNAFFWEDAVYIGLLPFVLGSSAVMGALRPSKHPADGVIADDRRPLTGFLVVATTFSFLLAFGSYTPVFPFLYRSVPTFNMFQAPARITLVAVTSLVILAGLGVDRWKTPTGRTLYWTRLSLAGGVAVMLGAGAAWFALRGVRTTFIRAVTLAGIWAVGTAAFSLLHPQEDHPRAWWPWAVAVLLSCDLLVANWGIQPATSLDFYQNTPQTLTAVQQDTQGHRLYLDKQTEYDLKYIQYLSVQSYDPGMSWEGFKGYLLPDANLLAGIASANNFDPLLPGDYAFWMDRVDALSPAEREGMLRQMDVSAVEKLDPTATAGVRFDKIDGAERFTWTGCALDASSLEQSWAAVAQIKSNQNYPVSGQPVVILGSSHSQAADCDRDAVAQISVIGENPNGVRLQVDAARSGWLVQADTWYPGWIGRVDGKAQTLSQADVTFRAIAVPAGVHEVEILYRPISFYLGAVLSLLSISGLIGWAFYHNRK